MRFLGKILLWIFILCVIIFIVSAVLVAMFGKNIVEKELTRSLKTKATIKSINLGIPFSVNIRGLEIENLASAASVSFYPDLSGLFSKKLALKHVNINNARFIYIDQKRVPGFKIIFDRIDGYFSRLALPLTELDTQLKVSTVIADKNAQALGEADFSGWVNWGRKDMDGVLGIKNLEIIYFAPYYGNFISQRKLLSAKVNLSSKLKAENNNLKIASIFRLFELAYAQSEQAPQIYLPSFDLVEKALDLFTDKKGNLDLEFSLNTKLDKPAISVEELKQAIMRAAMKNLANQPPDQIIDKVNQTIKQFEDLGKQMKKIFTGGD